MGAVILSEAKEPQIRAIYALLLAIVVACGYQSRAKPELRVCADPNNLPYSNRREEGFENRLAELIARERGAVVRYTWWPQRRGFLRNTLLAHACDVVMGVPPGTDRVLTTTPYYRSIYVFVYRRDRDLHIHSFDDPVLRKLRIGVQLIGDDYANTPPVHALSRRGIIDNLVGFSVYGDYSQANPPARIIDAVISRAVDVAVVWGPLAGYFGKRSPVPLEIVPVSPLVDPPAQRFAFDISLAVRPDDVALRQELEGILQRKRGDIDALLRNYGVPRVPI